MYVAVPHLIVAVPFIANELGYPPVSLKNNSNAVCTWCMSEIRLASLDFARAEPKETKTTAAKMPMMAITTKSSIKVKPKDLFFALKYCILISPPSVLGNLYFFIRGRKEIEKHPLRMESSVPLI